MVPGLSLTTIPLLFTLSSRVLPLFCILSVSLLFISLLSCYVLTYILDYYYKKKVSKVPEYLADFGVDIERYKEKQRSKLCLPWIRLSGRDKTGTKPAKAPEMIDEDPITIIHLDEDYCDKDNDSRNCQMIIYPKLTGISKQYVEKLFPWAHHSLPQDGHPVRCMLCTHKIFVGYRKRTTPCDHQFHADCLLSWLEFQCTCPACDKDLSFSDPDDSDTLSIV